MRRFAPTSRLTRFRSPRTRGRGSVLIALVLALIIVQIAVIGIVTLGRFDHSLTKLRLESEQAQYAAESGINMALREVYNSADEDTDGTVGTISAKTVNGCTVTVTSSTSGGTTTLTATATAATAKRVVVVKYSG